MEETKITEEQIGIKNTENHTSEDNKNDLQKKYDELKTFSQKLMEKVRELTNNEKKVNEDREMYMMYKRMDYLFKIIDSSEKYPEDFVGKCINEVIQVLNFDGDESKRESN